PPTSGAFLSLWSYAHKVHLHRSCRRMPAFSPNGDLGWARRAPAPGRLQKPKSRQQSCGRWIFALPSWSNIALQDYVFCYTTFLHSYRILYGQSFLFFSLYLNALFSQIIKCYSFKLMDNWSHGMHHYLDFPRMQFFNSSNEYVDK
ncbi:MAG: hypothetical protein ACD_3C00225G0025, partial [uncultured bacterium (gcode 4)]